MIEYKVLRSTIYAISVFCSLESLFRICMIFMHKAKFYEFFSALAQAAICAALLIMVENV